MIHSLYFVRFSRMSCPEKADCGRRAGGVIDK